MAEVLEGRSAHTRILPQVFPGRRGVRACGGSLHATAGLFYDCAVAEMGSHSWTCPTCGRRVPLRAEACHCGMTRARAEELAAVAPAEPGSPRPAHAVSPGLHAVSPGRLFAAMPTDIKALVVGGALVMVTGLGWLVFGPRRPQSTPALLGWVDPGPAPRAEANAHAHATVQAPLVEVRPA